MKIIMNSFRSGIVFYPWDAEYVSRTVHTGNLQVLQHELNSLKRVRNLI
jgi:hypothetical protein